MLISNFKPSGGGRVIQLRADRVARNQSPVKRAEGSGMIAPRDTQEKALVILALNPTLDILGKD